MEYCGALLFVAILVIIWCASSTPFGMNVRGKVAKLAGRQGMTNDESVRLLSKIDTVFGKEDASVVPSPMIADSSSSWDAVRAGALKESEVEAHKRSLADMSPFTYTGPARPTSFLRDDDPYYLNTGIKSVGGVVPRSLRKIVSGPQAGARQATSASEADIRYAHVCAALAPVYDI
jgi:hypothetical protein